MVNMVETAKTRGKARALRMQGAKGKAVERRKRPRRRGQTRERLNEVRR
jgi:hypothetical protein